MYLNRLWIKKEKKKTLTISSNFKKKIDPSSLSKKRIESHLLFQMIKNLFKASKGPRKIISPDQNFKNQENRGKKFTRKFIEQQATKAFIKKTISQLKKVN